MAVSAGDIPSDIQKLESWLNVVEPSPAKLKPGAGASINWANTGDISRTSYSILYLHGFKASRGEGNPVHKHVARATGSNLFLARLHRHGYKTTTSFENFDGGKLLSSAEFAYRIAEKLGDRVIVMGTSTGASLALYLASLEKFKDSMGGIILYSPLIRFFGINAFLLHTKTGRALLSVVPGEQYTVTSRNYTRQQENIWYSSYKLRGVLELGKLIQTHMTPATFANVTCPVFAGYYYKNFLNQDGVVSIPAIKRMMKQLNTPDSQKKLVNFPDAQTHVICSGLLSKSVHNLEARTIDFLENHCLPFN